VWDVGLTVRRELPEDFSEETFTISVSAFGATVLLEANVEIGQVVFLKNPLSGNEIEGKVVRVGPPHGNMRMVYIDFTKESPEFWPHPAKR